MTINIIKNVFALMLICIAISSALKPARVDLEPVEKLRGDEKISCFETVPYIDGRQSPGYFIGITWDDAQTI